MKQLAFFALLSCVVTLGYSQNTKAVTETPVQISMSDRLGVDFEVKDQPAPDPNHLQLLQIDPYEPLRKNSEDVEVFDEASGLTIILYSLDRCRVNKESNPLFYKE